MESDFLEALGICKLGFCSIREGGESVSLVKPTAIVARRFKNVRTLTLRMNSTI